MTLTPAIEGLVRWSPAASAPRSPRRFKGHSRGGRGANVFTSEEDQAAYADHFARDESSRRPPAGGAPAKVEAIIRIANQYKAPLWPISPR